MRKMIQEMDLAFLNAKSKLMAGRYFGKCFHFLSYPAKEIEGILSKLKNLASFRRDSCLLNQKKR